MSVLTPDLTSCSVGDEEQRLEALHAYQVLDSPAEDAYDDFTRLAARICDTPTCLISLVDRDRQWFKSRVGLDVDQTEREAAFCAHAILTPAEVTVVNDAPLDERFACNRLVTGEPHIRFYAGAPLVTPDGHALGTLCVIDYERRELNDEQVDSLRILARQIVNLLELRRSWDQLNALAAELSRSNEELKQFTYIASHDLQEPLRKVTSFCQLLKSDFGDQLDTTAVSYLDYAVDGAKQMKTLICDLLRYSRLDTQPGPYEPTDAEAACDQAMFNLQSTICDTRASVTRDNLPQLVAYPNQLKLLFENLIDNALKYQDADGQPPEVHVGVVDEGSAWTFCIRDNGIGIESQFLDRIFVIFQRLHGRDAYSGTGIGLAICKRIVERLDGRIWVESEPGVGSRFFFSIPKA